MTETDLAGLADRIKAWGRELGFQQVGIAGIDLAADEALLDRWLAEDGTARWPTWNGTGPGAHGRPSWCRARPG